MTNIDVSGAPEQAGLPPLTCTQDSVPAFPDFLAANHPIRKRAAFRFVRRPNRNLVNQRISTRNWPACPISSAAELFGTQLVSKLVHVPNRTGDSTPLLTRSSQGQPSALAFR